MSYLAIAGIAYIAFVFISESLNPFKIRKDKKYRRHRLARSIALILFFVSTLALLLKPYLGLSDTQLMLGVLTLCAGFSIKPLFKFFRFSSKSISPSVNETTKETSAPTQATVNPNATAEVAPSTALSLSSAENVNAIADEMVALEQMGTAPEQPSVSMSEEHQLELDITDANDESDFDSLDQTIAEAEFIEADLTISETTDIASPDRSTQPDEFDSAETVKLSEPLIKQASDTTATSAITNDIPSNGEDSTENLLKVLRKQHETIESLAKNNEGLQKDRDTLTDELSQLKFSLQKANATARKGVAQRDQAIKLKNNALALAAMEVKKRKLTEIKAKKAIMKMSQSLKLLRDESVS